MFARNFCSVSVFCSFWHRPPGRIITELFNFVLHLYAIPLRNCRICMNYRKVQPIKYLYLRIITLLLAFICEPLFKQLNPFNFCGKLRIHRTKWNRNKSEPQSGSGSSSKKWLCSMCCATTMPNKEQKMRILYPTVAFAMCFFCSLFHRVFGLLTWWIFFRLLLLLLFQSRTFFCYVQWHLRAFRTPS